MSVLRADMLAGQRQWVLAMDERILGCVIVLGALIFIASLVFWSRRTIDRIAASGYRSARQIIKELRGDG